jgi:hypothetical protein
VLCCCVLASVIGTLDVDDSALTAGVNADEAFALFGSNLTLGYTVSTALHKHESRCGGNS